MGISCVTLSSENSGQLHAVLKKAGIKKELFQFSERLPTALSDQIAEMIDPKYKGNFLHKLFIFPFIMIPLLKLETVELILGICRKINTAFLIIQI